MKTYINKFLSLTALLVLSLAFVACGKKSDDNNNQTPTSYYMSGGICYSNLNQQVATTYCNNSGYIMQNGYCYQGTVRVDNSLCASSSGYYVQAGQCYPTTGNAQPVPMSYCQNTGNTGATTSQVCQGEYVDQFGTRGTCGSTNNYCRNMNGGAPYVLTSVATGQRVQCI